MRYFLLLALLVPISSTPAWAYPVDVVEDTPEQVSLLIWSDTRPVVTIYQGATSRVIGGAGMYRGVWLLVLYGRCPAVAIATRRSDTFYLTHYMRPCLYLPMVNDDPV